MSCISAHDPQLSRLADAISQRVGSQRFHVWFDNSTRLELKSDGLDIAVPNEFISDWIGTHFTRSIQDAAHEVLGGSVALRFHVMPQMFVPTSENAAVAAAISQVAAGQMTPTMPGLRNNRHNVPPSTALRAMPAMPSRPMSNGAAMLEDRTTVLAGVANRSKLRHDISTYIVGPTNQLAYNAATYVSEFPGSQYNPLFIHGSCGLGKTHLLQGLCKKFIEHHPTKRWLYLTGEEFTNEFLSALRNNRIDTFRRRMRELDLLVIDDVHFLGGKKATQEEFLHTFNAIEAMGKQVVLASDAHPKMVEEFGESLVNRFVSGMVVRVDPPNYATRCQILSQMAKRERVELPEEVVNWIARRVTQNVRELEGAVTRIAAHVQLSGRDADMDLTMEALGDLDRQLVAPVKPENVLQSVCDYFGLENKDLMSGRRQRTISLARSVAMFLVRKTAKLSFPEIGLRMGKRNHSTVISACRRIERAVSRNEPLAWSSSIGDREEEASELIQRLEEHARAMN